MNKIGFAFSCILFITGVVTLQTTAIVNLVMPKIGLAAFQSAMAGSYSPNDYHISFLGANFTAFCLIIIGIVFAYRLYTSEKNNNSNQKR